MVVYRKQMSVDSSECLKANIEFFAFILKKYSISTRLFTCCNNEYSTNIPVNMQVQDYWEHFPPVLNSNTALKIKIQVFESLD